MSEEQNPEKHQINIIVEGEIRPFAELFAPISQRIADSFARVTANFTERISESIQPAIRQITDAARKLLDTVDLHSDTARNAFAAAGFWLTPSMTVPLLVAIKRLDGEGSLTPTAVKQLIVELYSENDWQHLRESVNDWRSKPHFQRRMPIIEDALEAHLAGRYTLSIPAILPQVEGIASEILGVSPGRPRDIIRDVVTAQYPDFSSAVARDALISYLMLGYGWGDFAQFAAWLQQHQTTEQELLHRHAILHGVQVNYASRENSLRAFLLLDALAWT